MGLALYVVNTTALNVPLREETERVVFLIEAVRNPIACARCNISGSGGGHNDGRGESIRRGFFFANSCVVPSPRSRNLSDCLKNQPLRALARLSNLKFPGDARAQAVSCERALHA